jgi:hypothetical protein
MLESSEEEERENKRPNLGEGKEERKGTPPPTLPEVENLTGGVRDGFLGEDLFRDIR